MFFSGCISFLVDFAIQLLHLCQSFTRPCNFYCFYDFRERKLLEESQQMEKALKEKLATMSGEQSAERLVSVYLQYVF